MKKRTFWNKVGDFLEGRGFYIVLALCLAAIGGSGYYLYRTVALSGSMPTQTVSSRAEVPADPEPDFSIGEPEEKRDEREREDETVRETADREARAESDGEDAAETGVIEESPTEEAEGDQDLEAEPSGPDREAGSGKQEGEEPEETPGEGAATAARWLWPVEGEVVEAFSTETLTYNAALEDWRTHRGIDIAARPGDTVAAAAPGTVIAVRNDVMLGRTVTVQSAEGLHTVYGNLADQVSVTAGDQLEAGQVIGSVGETAAGESHDGAWLHFAVEQDGTAVDPMEYLK